MNTTLELKGYEKSIRFFSYTKNLKFGKQGGGRGRVRKYAIEYFYQKLFCKTIAKVF